MTSAATDYREAGSDAVGCWLAGHDHPQRHGGQPAQATRPGRHPDLQLPVRRGPLGTERRRRMHRGRDGLLPVPRVAAAKPAGRLEPHGAAAWRSGAAGGLTPMSRAPKPIDPTASPRHRFGFTLRQLRTQAGFSLQGFAQRLDKSVSYLSAVELAE